MEHKIKPGDRLAIAKGAFITHYGIYCGGGMVIDNSNEMGGVRERPLKEFSGGQQVRVVPTTAIFTPKETVARARAQIGKGYGWFSQNCEHFVNEMQYATPKSVQVAVGATVAALVIFTLLTKK